MKVEHKIMGTYVYELGTKRWRHTDLIDIRAGDIFMDEETEQQFLAISNAYEKDGSWTVEVSVDLTDLELYYDILPKEVL